jgi:hypothetical protein
MVKAVFSPTIMPGTKPMTKDEWRLLRYGLLAAALMLLSLWPFFAHGIDLPKIIGELICGVIGVGMFLLSRYRTERKRADARTEAGLLVDEQGEKTKAPRLP